MKKNLFIAFEGIDGSGKSTQAKLLAEHLRIAGQKVHTTFEPTDSKIGSMIRSIMKGKEKADERTIAALFAADRLDHILNEVNGLKKMLNAGFTVISDRYFLSSYAYHSVHVPMDWVMASNSLAVELLKPDIHIFIDVNPEESMRRIMSAREEQELYETESNLKMVRDLYFKAFEKVSKQENIKIINGMQSQSQVFEEVVEAIEAVNHPVEQR